MRLVLSDVTRGFVDTRFKDGQCSARSRKLQLPQFMKAGDNCEMQPPCGIVATGFTRKWQERAAS